MMKEKTTKFVYYWRMLKSNTISIKRFYNDETFEPLFYEPWHRAELKPTGRYMVRIDDRGDDHLLIETELTYDREYEYHPAHLVPSLEDDVKLSRLDKLLIRLNLKTRPLPKTPEPEETPEPTKTVKIFVDSDNISMIEEYVIKEEIFTCGETI